ncbi:MAG: hypothetical protein ACLGIA_07050, partial [Actinomycetes bacterium]
MTAPMPELVRPMLATLGELPPSSRDGEYAYEMKWDGVRAVLYVGDGRLRVVSRNDRDVAVSYPELGGVEQALSQHQAVLDGEIIALDPSTGRVSFGVLQQRMHVQDRTRAGRLAERFPVAFLAFDVLFLDGRVT